MFRYSLLTFLILTVIACKTVTSEKDENTKPKNIILIIGDGMGPAYIKAYRMFRDNLNTPAVESTIFDTMLVGTIATDPFIQAHQLETGFKYDNSDVTDSAAAGTAFSTGVKVANGVIAQDMQGKPLLTVMERAKQLGKSTGIVATTEINHATPATFLAHNKSRQSLNAIADSYFDNQFNEEPYADVLLGGGLKYFLREDRNLVADFQGKGYQFVDNKNDLNAASKNKILGLFMPKEFDKQLDMEERVPTLAEMTKVAIEKLSNNENGFLLMVEGSLIDFAGHEKDIIGSMSEMKALEQALVVALDFAKKEGDTQIILTADHSTGGLSVGTQVKNKKHYEWNNELIRSFDKTPIKIVKNAIKTGDLLAEVEAAGDINLSEEQKEQLRSADLTKPKKVYRLINQQINDLSFTGWTTMGHTGVDVNLYGYGPATEQMRGHWDNTQVAHWIFDWME